MSKIYKENGDIVHNANFRVTTKGIVKLVRMFAKEGDLERAGIILGLCGVLDFSNKHFLERLTLRAGDSEEQLNKLEKEIFELEEMLTLSNMLARELSDTMGGDWTEMVWYDESHNGHDNHWRHGAKWGQFKVEELERPCNVIMDEFYYLASIDDNISLNKKTYESLSPQESIEKIIEHYSGVAGLLRKTFPINWGNAFK